MSMSGVLVIVMCHWNSFCYWGIIYYMIKTCKIPRKVYIRLGLFIVIVSIMMETKNQKMSLKIDWNALDNGWADQYEEDYGNHFSSAFSNNHRISMPAAHIEASMVGLA